MSSPPSTADRPDTGACRVVFEDGLGLRVRDGSGGDLVERLVMSQELMRFESALRDRMGRLANFRHVRYPRVRAVERTGSGDEQAVSVVTDAVKGHRLAALLDAAEAHDLVIEVNAALQVARELLPALSVLHDSRNVTHGAIGPERIVLTTEARIVIVDHTVGLALERLRFPRSRLWREFRIAMPPSAGLPQFDQRADVAQVAMVVLALMLGRHIGLKEFPDGLRTLAAETPERLGGGALRPMTASLHAWFERALPLDSRRPFTTAFEAQIALENVVTREVAYSPRPGTLRTLLQRYEELCGRGDGVVGEPARRESDAASAAVGWGAQGQGSAAPRPTAPASQTRYRAGAKGRKAPTPEELEAQEIARLETELARLMNLESQDASSATAEPALPAKVVRFPGHAEPPVEPPAAVAPPVEASPEPVAVDAPPVVTAASDAAGPVADLVESEGPLGEEEIAALTALLEVETQVSARLDERVSTSEESAQALRLEDMDATDVVLEVDLDAALEELITDALQAGPTDDLVWVVEAADTVGAAGVEAEHAAVTSAGLTPDAGASIEQHASSPDAGHLVEAVAMDAVEADAEAWSLTPLSEDDAVALARRAETGPDVVATAEQPARDEHTCALDYEAQPELVALAFARSYHRRLAASLATAQPIASVDLARVLSSAPRVVEVDPARALPLKRQPVSRRAAALARAPEPAGALVSNATDVFATLAVCAPAGAVLAPAAIVTLPAERAGDPATLAAGIALAEAEAREPIADASFLEADVPVAGPSAPEVTFEAVAVELEPSGLEALAWADAAPSVDLDVAAEVEVVAPAEVPAEVDAAAELTLAADVVEFEPSGLEALAWADAAPSVDLDVAAEVEAVAPAEVPAVVDAPAEVTFEAVVVEFEPSGLEALAWTDAAPSVDVDVAAEVEVVAPAEVPAVVDVAAEVTLAADVVEATLPEAIASTEAAASAEGTPPAAQAAADVVEAALLEAIAAAEAAASAEVTSPAAEAAADVVEAALLEAIAAAEAAASLRVDTTAPVRAAVDVAGAVDAAAAPAVRLDLIAEEVAGDESTAADILATAVLDSSAGPVFEASAQQPFEEAPEGSAPEAVVEPATLALRAEAESGRLGPREESAGRAKRRKRRRKKTKRGEPESMPGPVEVAPPIPSPVPVVKPVAPWLRGRDLASAPERPAPASASTAPPVAVSPISAAPPWTRRGREPLPVLPSAEGSLIGEAALTLTPPVPPLGDTSSPQESASHSTAAAPPHVPKPVLSILPAAPPAEPVARQASAEQPQESSGYVLSFPARRPQMRINWRRTMAASIVIMLIEGGAFATAYWYVKPRAVGYLLVSSTVTGLNVSIDGHVRGKTPLSLELPPGRHTIELRGYGTTKIVPVEIAPNVQTSQMVAWPRPPEVGRLSLKTTPEGAQVILDGESRGVAPLTVDDLAAGTHQVVVRNESGSVEQTVRVVADETLEIDVPIYSGWLALFAPVEVRIFEDGKLLGTSLDGRILMPPGRHRLDLVNQRLGYRQTRDVVIQPGRVVGVSVEAPHGTLVVEAPAGTSVSVDGEAMGVTPLGELSVEVGTREILFHHPELGHRRVTVTVGVGSPARANMLAPR